jgi:hypothetical protein
MSTLTLKTEPLAIDVTFDDETFRVALEDGRELAIPIEWFPRLRNATAEQRSNWRLIGRGEGIHWPDLDEDISVLGLLAGFGDTTKRKVAAE